MLQKKFIFHQLSAKLTNFDDIRRKSVFTQKKEKNAHFKTINHKKSRSLSIFAKIVAYLHKNRAFKINQPQEMFIIQQLISNFADFWQNNNVLMQNNRDFKKFQLKKSF